MEARDFVHALVKDMRLTQQEVSKRTGLAQGTISKIMRGAVKDVLSRHYRSLEAMYAEELTKRRRAKAKREKAGA